jgi:hypothetical protein
MADIDVKDLFIKIGGNLHITLTNIVKCLINNKNYNNTPVIHIYGNANNNKLLFLSIIELIYDHDEYAYLNELLLYNNYAHWYNNKKKIGIINGFKPMNIDMVQNNVINLSQNNIYVNQKNINPSMKFIILSNYDQQLFSSSFNGNTTHINFNMVDNDKEQSEYIYSKIQDNKQQILDFIKEYIN